MAISRRDLVLNNGVDQEEVKKKKNIDEGSALLGMTETYGWKILYRDFIQPNIDINRILTAEEEKLADIRAEMKILMNMLSFINSKIDTALKSTERGENDKS